MISAVIVDRISECAPFLMDALTLGQEGRVAEETAAAARGGGGVFLLLLLLPWRGAAARAPPRRRRRGDACGGATVERGVRRREGEEIIAAVGRCQNWRRRR